MEIKQIKELMSAMGRTGMKKLLIKKEGFELHLERQDNGVTFEPFESVDEAALKQENALHRASIALSKQKEISVPSMPSAESHQSPQEETASMYITSPMVGTFYSSPSPDDAAFVKIGDKIEKHTVVCIIEAMKVMNEVKAGVAGVVAEILVESGHPVEFGTKLFRIT